MESKLNLDDYKQIRDLILLMDKEVSDLKVSYTSSVFSTTGLPVTQEVFDIVLPYSLDYIRNEMDISDIKKVLEPYEIIESGNPSRLVTFPDDDVREAMATIKSLSLVILELEKESNDIKQEASGIMNEYINYLSSQRLLQNKEEKLRIFKEANEIEVDDNTRRINDRNIKILENQITFKFLTDYIDNGGYKAKLNIIDKFFNNKRGELIISKFKASAKKFGYNPDIFTHFLNIEETFLPEEYHPFNNLFLSVYMNFAGFCNYDIPADKLYMATITSAIASLIYHTYENKEDEDKFIEFIKSVIDRFKDDPEHGLEITDRFKMYNRSYRYHPDRVRLERDREIIARNTLFKRLEDYNIENPFDDDCNIDDLKKYVNEKINELKEQQLELAKKDDELEISDNDEALINQVKDQSNIVREKLGITNDSDTEYIEEEEVEEPSDDTNEEPTDDIENILEAASSLDAE